MVQNELFQRGHIFKTSKNDLTEILLVALHRRQRRRIDVLRICFARGSVTKRTETVTFYKSFIWLDKVEQSCRFR